ncbi:MAG: tRNA (adenosine(37)-N6)-threonylcarbamoyltransferase complex dimerization subunit type 1 TsaB [Sulfitobacter sp.]
MPSEPPLILAFDTSAAHCAAALLSGDRVVASAQESMTKGQAERLMGLCSDLVEQSGHRFCDLDAVGVGVGPGNFTGIRISVSAARGLAMGLGIPAVGINAFDALRYGTSGPCQCVVDARRNQVYVQQFSDAGAVPPLVCSAQDLAGSDGPIIGTGGRLPDHPTAIAIAHLTARRYRHAPPRPAPLYLRPADAAPARDTPPVILK